MNATVAELLRDARARLSDGDADPRIDAEVLLSHATGQTAAALIAGTDRCIPEAQVDAFKKLVERRARGEPVAYLLGRKEFWSLNLTVTPEVLIPRPETELLVERALAFARGRHRRHNARILELGTGSGAVALALASELPDCKITATDISPAAIKVAENNRHRLAAAHPALAMVKFRAGNWFEAAPGHFDLIVSNPPYIAPGDPHLQCGDVRFEPRPALVSARDGLADITKIIAAAPAHLNPGGMLLLEHGCAQAAPVREMLARRRFTAIATHRDLAGHERVTGGEGIV